MPTRRRFLLSAATAAIAAPSIALSRPEMQAARRAASSPPTSVPLPAAIAALPNRRTEAVPITLPEREGRLHQARQLLAATKIDALVICTGSSLTYFTGLRWGQSERLFAWVLPARSNPFIVCPVFEEGRVRERMDAHPPTLPAADTTRVYTWNEDEDPYALLTHALREAGVATGRIGIEEKTQFAFSDGIARASPNFTIVSATSVT